MDRAEEGDLCLTCRVRRSASRRRLDGAPYMADPAPPSVAQWFLKTERVLAMRFIFSKFSLNNPERGIHLKEETEMEKFAFCLERVRGKGRTYRQEEIFKTGGDNPSANDDFYSTGHFVLADTEEAAREAGFIELKKRGIIGR